jgi:hypothetical protein
VKVNESGRNVLVELAEGGASFSGDERPPRQDDGPRPPQPRREERAERSPEGAPAPAAAPAGGEVRATDAVREVRRLFQSAQNPPRWPMYIRQAKQFMRNVDASFDERKFGFPSLVDLLRACQRDGLFRMERDRPGVIRLFPGNVMQHVEEAAPAAPVVPGAPRPWPAGDRRRAGSGTAGGKRGSTEEGPRPRAQDRIREAGAGRETVARREGTQGKGCAPVAFAQDGRLGGVIVSCEL